MAATLPVDQRVLKLIEETHLLRARDLDQLGLPRESLRRLLNQGKIERIGRGLYMLPNAEVTEHHSLVEASRRVPQGVVCLLSALRFHDLTTQNPFDIWMAIEQKAWRPRVPELPLRFVYLSPCPFEAGVETHDVEGIQIRVYSAAKTVVDCFKFRNKIGLDVALEALRDYRSHHANLDELWRFSKITRVTQVMRPYLEGLQ